MVNWLMGDGYDGLRLCSVCGDRETPDSVCWVCRQQQEIDASVPPEPVQFTLPGYTDEIFDDLTGDPDASEGGSEDAGDGA